MWLNVNAIVAIIPMSSPSRLNWLVISLNNMLITFTGECDLRNKKENGIDISVVIIFYGRSWLEFMMRRLKPHVHLIRCFAMIIKLSQILVRFLWHFFFVLKSVSRRRHWQVYCSSCSWYWNSRILFLCSVPLCVYLHTCLFPFQLELVFNWTLQFCFRQGTNWMACEARRVLWNNE